VKIDLIDVRSLQPLHHNPRRITDDDIDRLRRSIQSFGLFKPLLVWRDGNGSQFVIGGNQRLRVLSTMADRGELPLVVNLRNGTTVEVRPETPCVEFPGTEAEARAVALRDNNSDGDWDWDTLPSFVAELSTDLGADVDLSALTGFDASILTDLASMTITHDMEVNYDGEEIEPFNERDNDRKVMLFKFGKVSGNVPLEVYERFLRVFASVSKDAGTKEIKAILTSILDTLEGS
jgi:hypothetical protein